ncbi:protein MSP1-like [Trifolium pratense]|uniref:Protein MSP1-like n=1 Tax=Trifolium pratense TaxID=57577 RepID=A0A2K3NXU7_TRIPR|nr:protein MSP1-like [Trifolium pratense]
MGDRASSGYYAFPTVNLLKSEVDLSTPIQELFGLGQPRRHLLTTGWSVFVGAKKHHYPLIFKNAMTSQSEFIVSVNKYLEAQSHKLSVGMRFKMGFEGDEVPERRFSGTIVSVGEKTSTRWPDSKQRSFKIRLLQFYVPIEFHHTPPICQPQRNKRHRPIHTNSGAGLDASFIPVVMIHLNISRTKKFSAHLPSEFDLVQVIASHDQNYLSFYQAHKAPELVWIKREVDFSCSFEEADRWEVNYEDVKKTLNEVVILPMRRPQLFSHGNLLRWFGDAEKLTKALFSFASKLAPVIIFVDESAWCSWWGFRAGKQQEECEMSSWQPGIDGGQNIARESLFLVPLIDPLTLMMLIYVDLPDAANRVKILNMILAHEHLESGFSFEKFAYETEGYSGSDLKNLCVAAAYRPVQELPCLKFWE